MFKTYFPGYLTKKLKINFIIMGLPGTFKLNFHFNIAERIPILILQKEYPF